MGRVGLVLASIMALAARPSYGASVLDAINAHMGDTVSVAGTTSNYYRDNTGSWSFDVYDDTGTISVDTAGSEAKCAPGSTVSVTGTYDEKDSYPIIRSPDITWGQCVPF